MTSVSGLSGERFEVVVVGGGLAGLATAASLCSQGCHSILVLESETVPGAHSSGKNAGLVRQAAEDPQTTELCVRGAELIRRRQRRCPDLFQQSGSLIISDENHVPASSWAQVEPQILSEDAVRQHYPELQAWPGGQAYWTPTDGIIDVPKLLGSLMEDLVSGGGDVAFGAAAGRVKKLDSGGFQIEVRASSSGNPVIGEVLCDQLVIANGAWAAEFSGASDMPISLNVTNRGCLITDSGGFDNQVRPWIWSDLAGWYLRPMGDSLLWSACEEEEAAAGVLNLSTDLEDYWREKVKGSWDPSGQSLKRLSSWVGQRTFCPDRKFLLGEDSRCHGWHWAVGLGGHGVTCALAVGERVAGSVLGEDTPADWAWSEDRFVSSSKSLP
ncbi:MAG: NAD(P)/FAD-dependent oxidoreductase [Planctomycetota bacterium]